MPRTNPDSVSYLVQRRLREAGRPGRGIRVTHAKPKRDPIHGTNWGLVRVQINAPVGKIDRYFGLLSDVEERLESEDRLNALLVPTVAEEQVD